MSSVNLKCAEGKREGMSLKSFSHFAIRVVILHAVTFIAAGWIALALQWEGTYGGESAQFFFRDPNSAFVQTWLIPAEVLRGILLAVALYPFLGRIVEMKRWGWLAVAVNYLLIGEIGVGTIELAVYSNLPASFLLASVPEAALDALLFGYLLALWQRRVKVSPTLSMRSLRPGLIVQR